MFRILSWDQTRSNQINMINLPDDVIIEIFKFASPDLILFSFSRVCKRFFSLSQANSLWQFKQEQIFPLNKAPVQANQSLFKEIYKQFLLNEEYKEARAEYINHDHQTVDVEKTDKMKRTLLHWAAYANQVNEIIPLIEAGSQINEGDWNNETPILLAMQIGHAEVVKVLLANGVEFNQIKNTNYLHGELVLFAALYGQAEVVKLFIERGADANKANSHGETPLSLAIKKGHLEVVKTLLDTKDFDVNKAHYNIQGIQSKTPLHIAIKKGRLKSTLKIVKLLIEKGADPNEKLNDDCTLLRVAAKKGHLEIVKLLLEKGATDKKSLLEINLCKKVSKNSLIDLYHTEDTLQKRIRLLKPHSQNLRYPNIIINAYMLLALKNAHKFLLSTSMFYKYYFRDSENKKKKAQAIQSLIALIYTDTDKPFSEHVAEWKLTKFSQDTSITNQDIISDHDKTISEAAKALSAPVISFVGFFSESNSNLIEKKTKTDTEVLIDDLVTHSQLWSDHAKAQENTGSFSTPLQTTYRQS